MLDRAFDRVYTKFKLHFYRAVFARFQNREASLTTVESFCMEIINALGHPTINEFSSFVNISPPNAAYKINNLIQKGYVTKKQSPDDKREYHLYVTQKYIDYYNVSYRYLSTVMERIKNRFPEEDVAKLEEMLDIIKKKEFGRLPGFMAGIAREAYETLLHTQDGQLCDIMVDKAALEAIYEAGKRSGEEIIRDYAESTVAVADIKIAVRSQKTAKSLEFMKRAMAECDSVNINALMRAAQNGMDAIEEYLESTAYKGGAKALKESASAFECWCDNRIVETIRPQLYNPFTIGPVVAYVLARENEIKTVRIILTGKQNDLPVESIRERVREMYV